MIVAKNSGKNIDHVNELLKYHNYEDRKLYVVIALSPSLNHNRYKRGLETCPQANLRQSGREYFFSFLFFPTRPSDEYDSAPSQKYSRPL